MSVHHQCTEDFTKEELEEAKKLLNDNQTAFYQDNDIGFRIRNCAIEMWKKELINDGKRTKNELQDPIMVEIIADLEDAADIKNAMEMNKTYVMQCIT